MQYLVVSPGVYSVLDLVSVWGVIGFESLRSFSTGALRDQRVAKCTRTSCRFL